MAEPLRRSANALLEAIAKASQNAEPAKFGQTAASVLSLMDGTSRIEAFRGIVDAADAADELSEKAVQEQKGLIVSKDDLKCILRYVDMAKALPLTKETAETYLGYKSNDSFFEEEKHKFLMPEKQVAFDKPIYDHAVQWDPLTVEIQNVGKTLTDYAKLFASRADSTVEVLQDLNKYLKVHGFIADDSGKQIVECGTEMLRLWKDDTGRHKDNVQKTYRKLGVFRDEMNDKISKSVVDRSKAIAALDLCTEQQDLQQEIDDLKQEIKSLEQEYKEAVGLAFTGSAGLVVGIPGIISWAVTGGIYGDRAEKIRKKKKEKNDELKEARTSWAGCKKIAEDLLRCFKEAYEEYGKTKK